MEIFAKLREPFPKSAIHWRAQTLTKNGDKALALAYVNARDVMERLDGVVGPGKWQDSYQETPTGRVLCTLAIKIGDEWISKTDGAGATAVEAEKGGISDAFKRAAVKWGIGRYLYEMPSTWVPCETYERGGKKHWSRWTADPWSFVRNAPEPPDIGTPPPPAPEPDADRIAAEKDQLQTASDLEALKTRWEAIVRGWGGLNRVPPALVTAKEQRKRQLDAQAGTVTNAGDHDMRDGTEPPF